MGTFDDFGNPDETPTPAPAPQPAPVQPDANPFTAIVNEAPAKPVAENPFTKIVDANADAEQAHELALRRTLYGVKDTDAARNAKVQQVSQSLGLPADVVGENLEAMQGAEKFQAAPLAHIAEHNPALAAYLAQSQNMAVLKDDLGNLTGMSAYVTGLQAHQAGLAWDPTGTLPPGFTYDKDGSILEHTYGVSEASGQGEFQTQRYDTLKDVAKALTSRQHFAEAQAVEQQANTTEMQGRMGPFLGVEAGLAGEYAAFKRGVLGDGDAETEVATNLGRASQAVSPGLWGDVQRMAGGLVADAPALLAGGALTRGAEAAMRLSRLSPLLTEAMGNKAAQWLATSGKTALTMAPVNAVRAADEARKNGAGAGITDFLASSTIMGLTGPTGVARALVRPSEPLVLRGWDAVGQHILKDAGLQATQGAAMVMSQVLQGTYQGDDQQLAHDLISQGELGGIAGAAFATLPALAARQALVETHRAAEGIEFGTKLAGLRAHWQATGAAEHSPDALQGAVGAMQAGQPTHVFAQGADWRDHWIAEGQDPQAKADQYGLGDQYREALALGSDMPIPLEKFVAAAADSKNPLNLEGKAKSAPGASSAEEGAKFYQQTPGQIKDQAQKLGEDAARLTAEGSPTSDAIHQDLLERLQAVHPKGDGQFTTSQLDTFAQFASTWFDMTARRSGMDPVEFYNAFPLDIAHGDFVAMHRDLTGAMESGDQKQIDASMQRMKSAAPAVGERIKTSATEGVPASAEKALANQYQQQGIPVPESASGLHRATTLRGIWKAAHGGKMPERGDKAWERLVEMSDRVDRARAAEKSGIDPKAKTERITRLHQGNERQPHGNADYAADKAGADAAEKRLGPDGVGRELVATLKDLDRVPLITAENVPYGMGMDPAGTKVYKDPGFPLKLKLKGGKSVDTLNTTKVHEITETRLMKGGLSYGEAHDVANAVERAYLKSKGYTPKDIEEYERTLQPSLRKVRDWTGEPPADLNRAPYEQEGETALLEKPGEAPKATDTSHLQPATKDWLDRQPEDVQQRLSPAVDYLRENPAPQGELGNLQMVADIRPRQKLNQPAYHGTPHKFDKFTTDHMGSGEGAQAYGWGLYFAGDKRVADWYRERLSDNAQMPLETLRAYFKPGRVISGYGSPDRVVSLHELKGGDWAVSVIGKEHWAEADRLEARIAEIKQRPESTWRATDLARAEREYRRIQRTHQTQPKGSEIREALKDEAPDKLPGRTYHVELPEDGQYLLWDKPMAEQPEAVKDGLRAVFHELGEKSDPVKPATASLTGGNRYKAMAGALGQEEASKLLLKHGIKGIKYLDGSSRAQGEGHHNYVIFDGADAAIHKYEQESRGSLQFGNGRFLLTTGKGGDVSTLYHELMHMWTEVMGDLAQRAESSQSLKDDYQRMLEFSGYGTHANKQAMQAEAARIHQGAQAEGRPLTPEESKRIEDLQAPHEKLSEALEKYLQEGVAPTPELRGMFRRISAWIKQVYRTLKASNVELTPEIRGVFDRLIASDDAIEKARQTLGDGEPMFRNAADAGWTQEQFDAYNKAVEDERASEEMRLQTQVMKELARQKSDAFKAKAAEVSEQVTELMDKQPVWNALNVLRGAEAPESSGIKGPFRIDRQSIVDAYGEDGLRRLPGRKDFSANLNNRGNPVYSGEDGVPLDAAAKVLGFSTGDELYEALANAPHKSAAVAMETDKIMQAKYPTLEKVLADKAMESLHSDRKSRLIMRVLDSLGVRTGQRPAPVELLRAVAKDTIANRATKDVRPKVYRDAEARAGREVLKAMAAGDYEKAFAEQQRRLLAAELFRAATDAAERVDKFRDWQTKFDKEAKRNQLIKASSEHFAVRNPDGTRQEFATEDAAKAAALRTGGQWEPVSDYMDAIDALRDRYQLSDRKPPASVRDFVNGKLAESAEFMKWKSAEEAGQTPDDFQDEQKRTAGITMSEDMIDGPGAGSVDKATVAEVDELNSALRNIEKLAMDRGKAITEDSTATFKEQRDALIAQAEESRKRLRKVTSSPTVFGKLAEIRDSMDAWHKALSTYAFEMDGYKEGGPWWDALVRPLNEAATRKAEMAAADAEAFDALAEKWGKRDNLGGVHRLKYYDFIDDKLSTMGRIMVALNWGAKHNRERLMTGHGWSEEQVGKLLGTLDKKDWDFVQGIWDHIASKWPDIKAQDQRLFGTELEQRETVPVQTEHGLYKGGYFPIKYDPRVSGRSAALDEATSIAENRRGAFGAAKTSGSFTKRVSETTGRRLLLDESVIFRHLDEVSQRLSHEDALKNIRRLLMNKELGKAIDDTHGVEANKMIRSAVTDAAKGTEQLGGMWKIVGHLNKGVLSAAFGLNVFRGIRDFAESLQQTTIRAGLVNTLSGLKQWGTNAIMMEGSAKKIAAMSRVMADRQRVRLRQASDAMKSADIAGSFRERMNLISQACMHKFHLATDHVSFLANLARAKQEFPDDPAKAIAIAEGMTKDANGSGQTVDLAKVQRGNELMKTLTLAYGFFSKTYQAQRIAAGRAGVESITNPADYVRAAIKSPAAVGRLFVDYLTLYSFPIAIDLMIKQAAYGDSEHKKDAGELAKEFLREHAAFGLATMVGLRELSGAVTFGGSYGGPAGARGLSSLYDLIAHGGKLDHHTERAAVQTLGILFHLPSAQIQRLVDGIAYAQEHNEGFGTTLIRGVSGKPPKQ